MAANPTPPLSDPPPTTTLELLVSMRKWLEGRLTHPYAPPHQVRKLLKHIDREIEERQAEQARVPKKPAGKEEESV